MPAFNRPGSTGGKAMNFKNAKLKTWLFAIALSALAGGMAVALPQEASARWKGAERGGIHAKIHKPVISGRRATTHVRIKDRRTKGPALKKNFHRMPPRKIIKHRRPPVRQVVVHRPRLRPLGTIISASLSYNLAAAPRYYASVPVYTSVGTGVSTDRVPGLHRISVSTELLNVRSGPDLNNSVICTVNFGEVLHVQGASHGWLHVTLADGRPGWVMEHYTKHM
jgi:hypothetical protein